MEDLHSIAFSSSSCNYLHTSSLLHDHLGFLNADISQYMGRSSAIPHDDVEFADNYDHGLSSTGYLEDVLFQVSSCKRRRLLMLSEHDQARDNLDCDSFMNCWTSDLVQNCYQNYDNFSQTTKSDLISDMTKTGEEANSESYNDYSSSSPNSHEKLESAADNQWTTPDQKGTDPIFASGAKGERKKRVQQQAKVAYPFALVKPGGFEGDMTLNDINERILMRPTRPVRHPVGDFACRPLASPNGPGLSGKAVVAFTRIHTPARGSITIIRTRG